MGGLEDGAGDRAGVKGCISSSGASAARDPRHHWVESQFQGCLPCELA